MLRHRRLADISCSDELPVQETLAATDACGTALVNPRVDPFVAGQLCRAMW